MNIILAGTPEYIIAKALLDKALSDSSAYMPSYVKEYAIVRVSTIDHKGYAVIENGSRFFKCWYTKMNIDFIPPTIDSIEEVDQQEVTTKIYV